MNNHFTHISQIGFVVKDMNKIVREMQRIFGVEPKFADIPLEGQKCNGKPSKSHALIAFYNFANVELEFVQPLSGQSIWQDFLDSGRSGLHHIRFSVNNFDGIVDDMKEKSINICMEGLSVRKTPNLRWGYFDSMEELDYYFEIFNEYEVL